jgi:hypothetical protein
MFHQLLHCQSRIVAHRLSRALQQSGVPALRPGDGRCQRMSVRLGNAGQQNLGETVHQGEQGLLRSIQWYHPLPELLNAGGQPVLGTDQFFPVAGQFLLHGMANERGWR